MSSGVSDQMKVPGNTAKNVEERNIPWSQQVDEASYENLASPNTDDTISAANQSSMQFQYPPFNAKENQDSIWNNYKTRKTPNNFETSGKYGKPGSYNNSKRHDSQPNAWGTHNSRRSTVDNSGNFNRANRADDSYMSGRLENKSSGNAIFDDRKKASAPPATAVAPKKTTWASIASQPAKLTFRTTLATSSQKKKGPGMPPPPMVPGKHNLDVNTWDLPNNNLPPVPSPPPPVDLSHAEISCDLSAVVNLSKPDLGAARQEKEHKGNSDFPKNDDNKSNYSNSSFGRVRSSPNGHSRKNWSVPHPLHQNRQTSGNIPAGPTRRPDTNTNSGLNRSTERRAQYGGGARAEQDSVPYKFRNENSTRNIEPLTESPQAVLEELRYKNNYNPTIIDLERAATARFFIIKSYSEDDIHRSIKYEIWCSTDHGNKRLDDAFKERHKEGGNILLFFSVNGSGHFCGMAQMMTAVDYNSTSSVWSQDKWKGKFKVKWIYVKDVPNNMFRHIRLENNENKSVTHSRDTQEVPSVQGIEVLQILHAFKHVTSIFDDFIHYEKKQEEEVSSKKPLAHESVSLTQTQPPISRQYNRQNDDRDSGRGGGTQKFFSGGGNSGSNVGSSFRERNITGGRGGGGYHNNFNDQRRFDGHRTTNAVGSNDYKQKDKQNIDVDRENIEYGNRNAQKFDFNRRGDDRTQTKHNNREGDHSEDHTKCETRFRAGPRETQKDNEYPTERSRVTDY